MKQVVGFGLFWESYLFPVSYKNKNYFWSLYKYGSSFW
jgi:hypothetical protein